MPSPAVNALLSDVASLAYAQRMRLLSGRALTLAGTDELTVLLGELSAGDRFERRTGLFMATVVRHEPTITAARTDPDWTIRRAAISAWLASGTATGADITALVLDASWHTRRHVYRVLRKCSAPVVVDGVIDAVRDRFGGDEAARLLPACSPATIARLLPDLGHADVGWPLICRHAPAVLLDEAERQLAALIPANRAGWWAAYGYGVMAARTEPERVLDLLERFAPDTSLPGSMSDYGPLAAANPERLIALMTAPARLRWLANAQFSRTWVHRLAETGVLAAVAHRLRNHEGRLAALLRNVAPSQRAALYAAARSGIEDGRYLPSYDLMAALPRALRSAEASRVLALDAVREDEHVTLSYVAYLPWPEAKDRLTAATRRALPEDRATAYELLIACAGRTGDPAVMSEVIEYLRRIRNEQDPVRTRVLAALTRVSGRMLESSAAEALDRIAADALEARDISPYGRQALSTLAITVLREHAGSPELLAWSVRALDRIFGDRIPWLGRIDTRLRRGQEADVFRAVRGWIEAGTARGAYEGLFAITRALGRRAWLLPELQEMLARAIDTGNVESVVRQAIDLWLDDPRTRNARVESVLLTDSSTVALHSVWQRLVYRRTDLLDLVLIGAPPRGMFVKAGIRWVPLGVSAAAAIRWMPYQLESYVARLARIAADTGAKTYARTSAISAAAEIPDYGWAVVRSYADSDNVNLAEAAIAGLAHTDRPADALPILLSHVGDDRARVAIYAAGRAARFVAPSVLGPLLAGDAGIGVRAVGTKVTSRKELIRIAAQLSVTGAGDILRAAWTREDQHRDVRAAVVSAARQRPDDPMSWSILEEAVHGGREDALAVLALGNPLSYAPDHRLRFGRLIADALPSGDTTVAQAAYATIPGWAQWMPDVSEIVVRRLTDLDRELGWQVAVSGLRALLDAGLAGSGLRTALDRLSDLDLIVPDAAGMPGDGIDRSARRRIERIVTDITSWSDSAAATADRSPLADAGRGLAGTPDFTPLAGALLVAAARYGHLADDLREVGVLAGAQPVAAGGLAVALARRLATDTVVDLDLIGAAAAELAADGDLASGLFAVVLTRRGVRLGWPASWRTQIGTLRRHPHPDVRSAALATVITPGVTADVPIRAAGSHV